jgi:transposase-like protein
MDFPIVDLLDDDLATAWILRYFHPDGLHCPHCGADHSRSRCFRTTRRSQLQVWRCYDCDGIYNLYSGTLFEGKHLRPSQVVLLLRGFCKGEASAMLARELALNRGTVLDLRRKVHANAVLLQPEEPLPDDHTETDEMFQNAGEKRHAPP